ncbi:hypothetical protein BaRGS_00005430, partial [Batillaria attramentaria]
PQTVQSVWAPDCGTTLYQHHKQCSQSGHQIVGLLCTSTTNSAVSLGTRLWDYFVPAPQTVQSVWAPDCGTTLYQHHKQCSQSGHQIVGLLCTSTTNSAGSLGTKLNSAVWDCAYRMSTPDPQSPIFGTELPRSVCTSCRIKCHPDKP